MTKVGWTVLLSLFAASGAPAAAQETASKPCVMLPAFCSAEFAGAQHVASRPETSRKTQNQYAALGGDAGNLDDMCAVPNGTYQLVSDKAAAGQPRLRVFFETPVSVNSNCFAVAEE